MNVNAINAVRTSGYNFTAKSTVVNNAQADIKPELKYNALDQMGALGRSLIKPKNSLAVSFTGWAPEAHNKETIEKWQRL